MALLVYRAGVRSAWPFEQGRAADSNTLRAARPATPSHAASAQSDGCVYLSDSILNFKKVSVPHPHSYAHARDRPRVLATTGAASSSAHTWPARGRVMAQCGHLQHSTKSWSSSRENVKTLIIGMWDAPGRAGCPPRRGEGGPSEPYLSFDQYLFAIITFRSAEAKQNSIVYI